MCLQKPPVPENREEKQVIFWRLLKQIVSWISPASMGDKVALLLRRLKNIVTEHPRLKYTANDRTSDFQRARDILKVADKAEAIRRRSIPNHRLKTTFEIENPFTTFDVHIHETSVKEIRHLLKISSYENEKKLIDNIFKIQKDVFVTKYGQKIPFKKFVMIISFKFAIKRFFPEIGDPAISEEEYSEQSLKAAKYITSLWIDSKIGSAKDSDKKSLFEILKIIFPQRNIEDTLDNPLGIILPSFETLWRVLFRLCFTLKFSDKKYFDIIQKFGKNPCAETFTDMKNDISVENIIKEILFLNPPTRTIYRDENNNIVAIDVQKLHENYTEGKKQFYPERWSKKNDLPFFTFGYGSLSCPARKFAPIILGLMGAGIFETLNEYQWDINAEHFSNDAEINDRNKYPDFDLIKKDLKIE